MTIVIRGLGNTGVSLSQLIVARMVPSSILDHAKTTRLYV
jgi:hypothetical protein